MLKPPEGEHMPRPSLRSRSYRKIKVKIPGGASLIHYIKRHPSKAKCGKCSRVLHGVKSLRPKALQKEPRTSKKVSRAYGGNLCASCSKEVLKKKVRKK